jgi:predicted transcriptional regulator
MNSVKDKSVRLYILKYIYREVRDQIISTKFLYKEGADTLEIPKKQLGNWLHLFVKDGLLVRTTESGKKGYRITQKGCQWINGGLITPAGKLRVKIDYCYLCNKKAKLFLYKGQYYCGSCVRSGESDDVYNLEDYIYCGPGYIW